MGLNRKVGLRKERAGLWVGLELGAGLGRKDLAGKNDAKLKVKGGAWKR